VKRSTQPRIVGAGEGETDWDVIQRLVEDRQALMGPLHGGTGKDALRASIPGYSSAARFEPWFVLTDLDHDAPCAPTLLDRLLPTGSAMCLRIPVRAVEAWLIADDQHIARFLSVPRSVVPLDPDSLDDPKEALVRLAARSARRSIRDAIVPKPESGRKVGRTYSSTLREFIQDERNGWSPELAAANSPSLARALSALDRLIEAYRSP
jgi:hypothetical protein